MMDKFKAKFVEESLDNVNDLEEALFALENDMQSKDLIERIFRAMHSLKGGGAMFGFNHLSEFTHHLENIFDKVRNDKLEVTQDLISLTFSAVDEIKFLLQKGDLTDPEDLNAYSQFMARIQTFSEGGNISENTSAKASEGNKGNTDSDDKTYLISFVPQEDLLQNGTNPLFLLDDLHALGNSHSIVYTHKVPSFELFEPESNYCLWQILLTTSESLNEIKDVFIFVEDECELSVEEICQGGFEMDSGIEKLITNARNSNSLIKSSDLKILLDKSSGQTAKAENQDQLSAEAGRKKAQLKGHKISSIRVASLKIDELVNLVSELVTVQAQLSVYAEKKGDTDILGLAENVQKLSRQLRDNAFEISLIPMQSELMRFQRLVRDLSKELGKEIEFVIEGGDIELDKNIIEHLTDPLLHILRNSVDHGIEMPDDRVAAGKSPKGNIYFKAYHAGASVLIEVTDDGRGINVEDIREKAISKGLIDENTDLSSKEILNLIFMSGFSTKDTVSDVSGRGVGMDVVRKKISEIRGEVTIDSEWGQGTTITLRLPLTLSIIDGLLVKVADNKYVVPISSIEKIFAIDSQQLKDSFNKVVVIEGEQIPYVDMRDVFKEEKEEVETPQMVLVRHEEKRLGLMVDEVLGEYQTVVKPLGRYLKSHEVVSGASILGDGTISMVIDTNRVLQMSSTGKVKAKSKK
ncbi:chemotaxis protein CheA [Marinilabilia rubra]|uniref:Chemotaxis protein CheA n=1 Tax=Marinilabilia rubra TaxID=2162893 RepID=A0A2U2B8Q0_9BACT|nr:chemotaxis protein CheA [Marinilabilia rubra]PWD99414.1 chemotaxis protein CheA [Marinilabilia rubra]